MIGFSSRGCGAYMLVCAVSSFAVATGCSSADLAGNGAGGPETATGGALSTGGSVSTGGADATGAASATGSASATGGARSAGGAKATGGAANSATGGASASTTPTWSQLYTNYFGPGTAGDCVASGCHGSGNQPPFNSATSMCTALKSYLGGTISFNSILNWLGKGGNMPANGAAAPANAVADINAWQSAGSVCP